MDTILRTENIWKTYESSSVKVNAINGISLAFTKGKFYAVIGRSGSGKSTLLYLLSGLDQPTKGKVYFEEKDLSQYPDGQMAVFRRRHMGFVFQQYNLMEEYNVLDNICMPVKLDQRKPDPEFLHTVLAALGLLDKQKKYAGELSGGEQQRVAIARSILSKPKIIFADEPTGNLDKKTAFETLELLMECAGKFGQTLIMVTHDLEIARMSETVITIEDGKVIE
ncbi:MAG: ABC transporter ATP-binding protein [Lachnospiraceae bacterium]|nr:ABC transporter ATP-binding protein [Lachnospiraceae bacterium]